jgi:hypothetical protein
MRQVDDRDRLDSEPECVVKIAAKAADLRFNKR